MENKDKSNAKELTDKMLDEVNGGSYHIYARDGHALLGEYTYLAEVLKAIQGFSSHGDDVVVETSNFLDDDSAEGVYLANQE